MKGVVAALVAASLLACVGLVMANPPLPEPLQYEQFCDNQKVSGTGAIDISTSVIDKKIALEYYNVMAGDGDLELDQTHAYSQKGINEGPLFNDSHNSSLNLFEKEKLTYSAKKAPLTGGKYLNSKAFYGGIGADVQEMFSVNQMEKDQTSFFSSTANLDNGSPNTQRVMNKQLKEAGLKDQLWGNDNNVSKLMTKPAKYDRFGNLIQGPLVDPAHMIGIDTKNSFNGTWGVDAKWHQIFYKDIKLHEQFTGTFEAQKMIKFHENPVPDNDHGNPCQDIDC
jgi:hypothetical protein